MCWFGLAGVIVTEVFLPDTTGLDLREQERYWALVIAGRENEYHGVAIHPRHLSRWERWVNKRHRNYDPVKDREARIVELRQTFEAMERDKYAEMGGAYDGVDPDEASFVTDDVASYFSSEKASSRSTLGTDIAEHTKRSGF